MNAHIERIGDHRRRCCSWKRRKEEMKGKTKDR